MSPEYILHIDTTGERGLVMLSRQGIPIALLENGNPMEHGSFLHPAIEKLMREQQLNKENIAAIAVANGPGSYTGLRVGLAAAKGLCYAWNIPLITLSSLQLLAMAAKKKLEETGNATDVWIVPMIDARRMEVFYAIYDCASMATIKEPGTVILDSFFLENELKIRTIVFTGNGISKWENISKEGNAACILPLITDNAFAQQANQLFHEKQFADLTYSQPSYAKEFFQQTSQKR